MQNDQTSSSGAYDFLNQQPEKSGRKLHLPKLPKMAWILLIGSVGMLLLLVAVALIFGGGRPASSSPYVESLSIAQEINRVSTSVKQMSQDPNTQSLAATTSSALLSNNSRLSTYLKDTGVKVDPKSLDSKEDKEIDTQMQEASQANRLPETYARYLSVYLEDYQSSLQAVYDQSAQEGKNLVQELYDSIKIILESPLVKSEADS